MLPNPVARLRLTSSNVITLHQKDRIFDTNQVRIGRLTGTLPRHSVLVGCAAAIRWGLP